MAPIEPMAARLAAALQRKADDYDGPSDVRKNGGQFNEVVESHDGPERHRIKQRQGNASAHAIDLYRLGQ